MIPEPTWLSGVAVEAAHAHQTRAHGGQPGLRDKGLLESTLYRPRHRWSLDPECDLADLAAAYGFGLIKNHSFLDGNKRIGFVAMNMFLLLNGYESEVAEPEVVDVMIQVAGGSIDEPSLATWVRSSMVPFQL